MKNAFTLIELIFVIVIIGLLAAMAVPKFLHLKNHAEAKSVIKVTEDGAKQAVEGATNYQDLENNNTFTLQDILNIKGKNWLYDSSTANGRYYYEQNNGVIAEINFSRTNREVNYSINCENFDDLTTTGAICENDLGQTVVTVHLTY